VERREENNSTERIIKAEFTDNEAEEDKREMDGRGATRSQAAQTQC